MAAGGSRYYQPTQIRRQDPQDVNRGLQVGQEVGKLLGGLAGAIKGAQKDALANKMMTDADISSQPGAGQTQDLGTLPGGPQPNAGGGSGGSTALDPDPDPIQTNQPGASINPNFQPEYAFQDMPDTSVNSAANQQQAATALQSQPAGATAAGGGDFTLNPGDFSGGGKTVGSTVHTGGVQEMELQKEMLALQMQKASMANSQASAQQKLADAQAKASGTGQYAVQAAIQRAQLAKAQQALQPKPAVVKPEDMPITSLDQEPVNNQAQLNKYIDTQYGKGAANGIASTVMEPPTIDDPKNPGTQIPNPNAPVITKDANGIASTITVGPKNKRVTMPIATAQTLVKQQNALNLKQNQPLLRVPGEDQSVGATADNPYPATSKLDALSRAHGTWVKLPGGQVAQVP